MAGVLHLRCRSIRYLAHRVVRRDRRALGEEGVANISRLQGIHEGRDDCVGSVAT